jgi:hypothetical protein
VSRATAREKWLNAGGKNHFTGGESTDRVREWRNKNPSHRQRRKEARRWKRLQFKLTKNRVSVARKVVQQDLIDAFFPLKGRRGSSQPKMVQQDAIAKKLHRAMLRVHDILHTISKQSNQ